MSSRLSRSSLVFLVFLLLGPPIGALAYGLLLTVVTVFTDPGMGLTIIVAALAFLPLAYLIGGLQAAFTGLVSANAVWRTGRLSPWPPLAAALMAAGFHVARAHEDTAISAILVAVHLAAAGACWLVARRL